MFHADYNLTYGTWMQDSYKDGDHESIYMTVDAFPDTIYKYKNKYSFRNELEGGRDEIKLPVGVNFIVSESYTTREVRAIF